MNIDDLLNRIFLGTRDVAALEGLRKLFRSVVEELKDTKEQLQRSHEELGKAKEKIQFLEDELRKLRKLPKRPEFRPNGMEPRNRGPAKNEGLS